MLRKLIIAALGLLVVGFAVFWGLTIPQTVPASALGPHTPNLANGKEMFEIGDCASCHATPGQKNDRLLGGGRALHTAFGTFYPPNISPDRKDGIGAWSEAQFITALVKGTAPGGKQLYPVFPYDSFRNMRYSDLRDLFAYIKTLPPVAGQAPPSVVKFPFSIRRAIGIWKLLFLRGPRFKPDPKKSALWNRGAYLVNGPGHCAECHSPRNVLGGIIASERFAGGPNPVEKGWVPNITQKGLAGWSVKDIAFLLDTGFTPDGDSVGSTMSDVVDNLSKASAVDRLAIATYIKSLPPVAGPSKPKKPKKK